VVPEDPQHLQPDKRNWLDKVTEPISPGAARTSIVAGIATIAFGLRLLIGVTDSVDTGELGFVLILLGVASAWRGARLLVRRRQGISEPLDELAGSLLYNSMRHPPAWKYAQERSDIPVVTVAEARTQLGLRTKYTVSIRALLGHLEPCWNVAGDRCVTQASVDEERRWWSESTPSDRAKRHFTQAFSVLASG
jgi:hypothetical protein